QPNVVQIGGMTAGPDSSFRTLDWNGNLKATIGHYAQGLIRLHTDGASGRLLGAAAFGHHAVEVMSLIQLAINEGLSWEQVTRHPYAHPSLSEVFA
ncbi:MAG: hypothetical protein KDC54_05575, partial [Lewinella sp.]|nr:hypothetical protein [Lewinella sp.]